MVFCQNVSAEDKVSVLFSFQEKNLSVIWQNMYTESQTSAQNSGFMSTKRFTCEIYIFPFELRTINWLSSKNYLVTASYLLSRHEIGISLFYVLLNNTIHCIHLHIQYSKVNRNLRRRASTNISLHIWPPKCRTVPLMHFLDWSCHHAGWQIKHQIIININIMEHSHYQCLWLKMKVIFSPWIKIIISSATDNKIWDDV